MMLFCCLNIGYEDNILNTASHYYFDVLAPKQEEVKRLPGGKIKKKVFYCIPSRYLIRHVHPLTQIMISIISWEWHLFSGEAGGCYREGYS